MEALRKTILKIVWPVVVGGIFILLWQCANPVDQPPLKWRSRIELPVTNDTFYLAHEIPGLYSQINDTIVPYYDPSDTSGGYPLGRLPGNPDSVGNPNRSHKYISLATANGWKKDHVYRWDRDKKSWEDLGEVMDMLMGGFDSAHLGIAYSDTDPNLRFLDSLPGDTCILSLPQNDSIEYEVTEDSMKAKTFSSGLGPITFGTVPILSNTLPTLPAPGGIFSSAPIPLTLPANTIISVAFDNSSPPLPVTIRNLSATATITNLNITLFAGMSFATTRNIPTLAPNGSATVSFPLVGASFLNRNIWVQVQGSTTGAAADLAVDFDFNGLIADYAQVLNHYVTFAKKFINNYELTDTLEVNYIDVLDGFFRYYITNGTDLRIEARVSQLHLWRKSFCETYNPAPLETVASLATTSTTDSLDYFGKDVSKLTPVEPHTQTVDSSVSKVNMSWCRLFPEWIDSTISNPFSTYRKSVAPVEYIVSPIQEAADRIVTINMTDTLVFTISAPRFKFKEMLGTVRIPYVREGDTAKVGVNYPFNSSSIDSMRGKFFFKHVIADIFLTPKLPDVSLGQNRRAYIDTLGVRYMIFSPFDPQVKDSASAKFVNVWNDKHFRQSTRIDTLLNKFPDSLHISVRVSVPYGTRVLAVNDLQNPLDTDYGKYMGRMNIKAITTVRTNIVLDWLVADTTNLDLGVDTTWAVPSQLAYFNRMENSSASFNMKVLNHTNVYMRLYALAGPDSLIHNLRAMRTDSVWMMITDTALGHQRGYVSFLGPQGIGIPARGIRANEKFSLNQWQINQILGSDTCAWRWEARFLPFRPVAHADSLRDTDFVYIQSWVHMEGINNMDSLVMWPKDSTR